MVRKMWNWEAHVGIIKNFFRETLKGGIVSRYGGGLSRSEEK